MATFLHDDNLNAEIGRVFREANQQLVIISPFIKLHSRLKDELKSKEHPHKIAITVVFGKNEKRLEKSLGPEEFNFLKELPNITIKYNERLHAKYYANEKTAILSSMNLYDFSQNNNIEFGILTESSLLGDISNNLTGLTLDRDAQEYFQKVTGNSRTVFSNKPVYQDGGMLSKVFKKYVAFETEVDELSEQILNTEKKKVKPRSKGVQAEVNGVTGYCIRTGVEIPFNPKKPLSDKAFRQWNRYKDKDYSEKFCHFSGESSNGNTSVSKPILKENWNEAKKYISS
ncbi:PLD-like domain-containing protein [Salinimicrobium catena]|uniref:PLD-like domain-containing protein n=1 Tax=Salinimicrobium catena TaxID=390640 RepID=A0A1H5N463_9FLAO|nr:phospholipase D-like domain-containing protein [Salinimicrobium catena]SDL36498.1 PLD-like domain-containing protein [Salinimicrobium catena]SEE96372.1 PLD-like domain-containing protein [Salinimicrobium catena]